MGDDATVSLLLEWGFEKYVSAFRENEVDLCALQLLDDVQVRVLIPAIGPQAKFKKRLSDWKVLQKNIGEALQNDEDPQLQRIISTYGDSLDGLTPSLSPPIRSHPASPSTSSKSVSVSSVSSHAQFDLTSLLETTPDGQLLLKHNPETTLGDQYRKILVRAITKEIVRYDPKAPVTAETYLSWLQEFSDAPYIKYNIVPL